jgi:hypothetical protein
LRCVFHPLSRTHFFITNANPACSCVYICKFQFRPIHPPSRRLSPTLLNTAGNHHYKLQRLMDAVQVKASSTQGARSRLARAQPRAGTVAPDEITSRPRASSGSGRTLGTPEAKLEQASSRSNLGQIASPTDRIAGAFNARIA